MNENTLDLAKLGTRELTQAIDLLTVYRAYEYDSTKYLPATWNDTNVNLFYNENIGTVYLTNDDYQILHVEDNTLVQIYHEGYFGHEGLLIDLAEQAVSAIYDTEENKLRKPDVWDNQNLESLEWLYTILEDDKKTYPEYDSEDIDTEGTIAHRLEDAYNTIGMVLKVYGVITL